MEETVVEKQQINHEEGERTIAEELTITHLAPGPKEYAKILRKIDWHIVPILLACYSLSFLDKVLINYANVMGLEKDLHMTGNDFSWLATALFIAFAVSEGPQGYFLQRYPVSKVLGINIFCWGVVVACTAATRNFTQMLALRVLLGCFEAVITPSLVLTTSMWYTKRQSAPRYGIWYCGLGVGQFLGGLISFGAQHGPQKGFGGWRIMMLATGLFNVLVAVVILIFLPNSRDSAKFLSADEKESLHRTLILDQAGNGPKVFRIRGVWEAFADLQVWLLSLLTILTLMSSGVITAFSATLINGFGYTPKQSALLNMPSGIVSIIATYGSTYAVLRGHERWLVIVLFLVPTIIGAGLMSFAPTHNQGAKLTGIFLYNCVDVAMVLVFSWLGANTAGYSKKVAANAIVAVGYSVGNIIGPQTFQARDAPQYLPAKITIFVAAGASMVVAILLKLLYVYRNRTTVAEWKAELHQAAAEQRLDVIEVGDERLTDRTNPAFVYVY
ncbi:hypothetical protein MMC08_007510 [Hypocenomyce scalaris]|nr:hypothetical protein [Hypocenomyce scalaris]